MRRIDYGNEWNHVVSLLGLREGELAIDMQTEPDQMLALVHRSVGERGRVVGAAMGTKRFEQTRDMIQTMELPRVEVVAAPPTAIPARDELFHAAVMRHTTGITRIEPVLDEMYRLLKSGGKLLAMHTQWEIHLPRASAEHQELIDVAMSSGVQDAAQFFYTFQTFRGRRISMRDMRFDSYVIANRDPRARSRHSYDWRSLLRERLSRARQFQNREILEFIDTLEQARGAKVIAERCMAIGIKPISNAKTLPEHPVLFDASRRGWLPSHVLTPEDAAEPVG